MSFVRLPCRLWMVALAGVLGAGGFGFSLAFTGSAAALEVPTITTSPLPVPHRDRSATDADASGTHADRAHADADRSCPDADAPARRRFRRRRRPCPRRRQRFQCPACRCRRRRRRPLPLPRRPEVSSPTGSVVLLGSGGIGPGGGSGSAVAGNAGTTAAAGVAGGSAAAPISRSSATTKGIQVTNVRGRKGAVRIVFRLARPGRVVVIVRGPLPDCSRVVRFVIQGRRGENALRFNGHAGGGRRLAEGSYLVGLRPVRAALTRWGALLVDPSGARALPRSAADSAVAHCSSAPAGVTPFAIGFLAGAERRDALPLGGGPGAAGERGGSATSTAVEQSASRGRARRAADRRRCRRDPSRVRDRVPGARYRVAARDRLPRG